MSLSERLEETPSLAQMALRGSAEMYEEAWTSGALHCAEGSASHDRARIKLEDLGGTRYAVVSVCGTTTVKQFVEAVRCWETKVIAQSKGQSSFKVHEPFWTAAEDLWKELKPHVVRAVREEGAQCILFTGHSRGAAVALLLFYMALLDEDVLGAEMLLITFASVRAADKDFRAELAKAAESRGGLEKIAALFVNKGDLVGSWQFWFEHPVKPTTIGSGLRVLAAGLKALRAFQADEVSVFQRLLEAKPLAGELYEQHSIGAYRESLACFCNTHHPRPAQASWKIDVQP